MAKRWNLSRFSSSELLRELERRQANADRLESRRATLTEELAAIDAEIAAVEGSPGSRRSAAGPRHVRRSAAARTRSANQEPLNVILHNLLKGRTMSVSEAVEAVQKAGYRSNAANFHSVVNLTLLKRKDLFKRVERGRYRAK